MLGEPSSRGATPSAAHSARSRAGISAAGRPSIEAMSGGDQPSAWSSSSSCSAGANPSRRTGECWYIENGCTARWRLQTPAADTSPEMRISGTVTALARFPVKSAGGEALDALEVDADGVAGDRALALTWRGHLFTARRSRRLLAWSAAGDPPVLTAPDGTTHAGDDPALAGALSTDLGYDVGVAHDPAGQPDVAGTVHLVTEASLRALSGELGANLDPLRFRANVRADLDAPAFAEEDWAGRTVRIGDAELVVESPCLRCAIPTFDPVTQDRSPRLLKHLVREHGGAFGIYLRALRPATIRAGDAVQVG